MQGALPWFLINERVSRSLYSSTFSPTRILTNSHQQVIDWSITSNSVKAHTYIHRLCRICKIPDIVKLLQYSLAPTPFGGDIQLTQMQWTVGTGNAGYGFQNFVGTKLIFNSEYFVIPNSRWLYILDKDSTKRSMNWRNLWRITEDHKVFIKATSSSCSHYLCLLK